MHNKILILPRINTAFVGTSFNLSLSADGNQENLLWFTDHEIVDHAVGAFLYDHENANTTVVKQSTKRNARINDPVLNLKAKSEIETAPNKDERVADAIPVVESRALLNANDLESHQVSRDSHLVPQRMCRDFYKLTK